MAKKIVKRTPTLAPYLDAVKEPSDLYSDISKHVLRKAGQPSGHRSDRIYPSEVVKPNWCHRATYMRIINGHLPQHTTFQRENVFAEGNNTHTKWQKWLAEMGRLEGEWLCLRCADQFYARAPQSCPACHSQSLEYRELRLNAWDLMLSGRCDGYCPADRCLIEIKTMGLRGLQYEMPNYAARYEVETERGTLTDLEGLWRDLRRPLPSAVRQGILYLYIAREYAALDVDRCVFIYDFKATQDSKAFTVPYDAAKVTPMLAEIRSVIEAVKTRTPPLCVAGTGCRDCRPYARAQ